MKSVVASNQKKWWVLVGVGIASFLGCIDFTIVNTALPAIQDLFHGTMTALQWVINTFILALATFMVIMGRLADIYGRRRVLYIGMAVFGLASLGAGLATSMSWLILCRFVQGTSCAILYTATGAIVSNAFPAAERGKAIGTLFGINGIGLAVGPVLGGIIVSALSWRWVFLINVPLIIISLLICFSCVHESYNLEHGKKIDWLGLLVLVIGLPCLVLGITQGNTWGWSSIVIISLFSVSACMMILFYVVETKAVSPIVQFHLFVNRTFIASIIATFSLAFFYCLAFFLMPLYLSEIRGEAPYVIGLMLLAVTAMVAIFSPIAGKAVDHYGPKRVMLLGLGLFAWSALLQANFTLHSSLFHILLSFVAMGIGWACILGPATVASLSSVPENVAAVAMGSAWTMHNIGGAFGLGVGIVFYQTYTLNSLKQSLISYDLPAAIWKNPALTNPETAVNLLQKYTPLNLDNILSITHQGFIAGYDISMWLLSGVSLLAMCAIFFMMKASAKK